MTRFRRTAAFLAALGLALFLLGCAADNSSGDGRHHGFYGGVEGGAGRI